MTELKAKRTQLQGVVCSAATTLALASDWRHFSDWCKLAGRDPHTADTELVELYLTHCAKTHKHATLNRKCWAIAQTFKRRGLASPVVASTRDLVSAIAREHGSASTPKLPLSVRELRMLVEHLDCRTARGCRDRAILVLGFSTGLRRSELAGLQLADVRFVSKGLLVTVPRSKTDQLGAGQNIGCMQGKRPELCPVHTTKTWLAHRGLAAGSLFHVGGAAIADVVQQAAAAAGLDASKYGAHSLRSGMMTALDGAGVTLPSIMARSRHKTVAVAAAYIRHNDAFRGDPLARRA